MRKSAYKILLVSFLASAAVQAQDINDAKTETADAEAIVVVTTRATSADLFPLNFEENKFIKNPVKFEKIQKRGLNIKGLLRQKNKYKEANKNAFYIRSVPAGKYAYVRSSYVTTTRNSIQTRVACKTDGAPVFEFESGNIYYFNAPDKFLNKNIARHTLNQRLRGYTLNEDEAQNYLNQYLGEQLDRKVDVKIPEELGTVTFDGSNKRSLGGLGGKTIKCPDGKDFTFTAASLDAE